MELHSQELYELALSHFNEPMLNGWDVVRCIGYGETGVDCYIIARRPRGQIVWISCVGGYTFLDRLKGQGYVISTSGEEWDDLWRLDSSLSLNGCLREEEFIIELRHDDMEVSAPLDIQSQRSSKQYRIARAWASIDGKAEFFDAEAKGMHYDDPEYRGHYEGYMAEARELLKRAGIDG